jgi:pimeloyl-ACP methyl ester carboxylesterase
MLRIESLLSARRLMAPQLARGRLYFVSDLNGRMSLYGMDAQPGGSVPEPLLPPHLALQNPHLIGGHLFYVFPQLGKIVVMLDKDGDENYQPMFIPLTGGFPEPVFGEALANYRCHFGEPDPERNLAYLFAESRSEAMNVTYRANFETGALEKLGQSKWGLAPDGPNADHSQVILSEGYTFGDNVLYHWTRQGGVQLLYGTPLEQREAGKTYPPPALFNAHFVEGGLLLGTALFDDAYGLGYLSFADPSQVRRVAVTGQGHTGQGEFTGLDHLRDDRYQLSYNIDGCSWLYEGRFDAARLEMKLTHVLCGAGEIANGVLESSSYDKASDTHALSFSTATSPTQIYTVGGADRKTIGRHSRERVLGLPAEWLSSGEDASFTSHDGLRVSARLYLPAPALGFSGPRPLVYYVHGGPQSQERPDFAWFSMPLIQYLTLNGFAVFTPNVRGSSGYGLSYMKRVDRDWGGQDRLDHVHAMTEVLPHDERVDVKRAGVVGRSYGGYMTLTLASRHPALWSAAVDMFGPYNLLTFIDRLPETWKPYFAIAVGDPEKDRDFLLDRSPSTYMDRIACPLLVIQGKNDPRVIERESRDVVERLRAGGRQVEYLMFEDEGHDVLKHENKVRCYNAITDFFKRHLKP